MKYSNISYIAKSENVTRLCVRKASRKAFVVEGPAEAHARHMHYNQTWASESSSQCEKLVQAQHELRGGAR